VIKVPLTLGVEEEYQIIDPQTRELTSYIQQMLNEGRVVLGDQIKAEFMQSQVEVGSHICRNIKEVRQEIVRLRRTVAGLAAGEGLCIVSASTHPFSSWTRQEVTEGERYNDLIVDMQDLGRRLLIFGLHVHVGFGDSPQALELLVDIMNQARYFMPHILCLTTSSPFWHGRNTGLKSYRSIIFEALPRTGIPPYFASYAEYDHMVSVLAQIGSLGKGKGEDAKDPTRIWWDARPQPGLGTLEFRIADACTTIDEAVCVVALFQAVVAKLVKLRNHNQSWRVYPRDLLQENKWRAVRYGIDGKLVDLGIVEEVPLRFLINELLEWLDDVLDELDIRREAEYARTILEQGTSADRQLATYRAALRDGAAEQEALYAVVDRLIQETNAGLGEA
jgi:carboxylate-amine ligase